MVNTQKIQSRSTNPFNIAGGSGKGVEPFAEMLVFRHDFDLTDAYWNHYKNMSRPDSGFALSEVDFKDFRAWCDADYVSNDNDGEADGTLE